MALWMIDLISIYNCLHLVYFQLRTDRADADLWVQRPFAKNLLTVTQKQWTYRGIIEYFIMSLFVF